ncbi:MAG: THUMP domain-containing protein, partial [Eubacteriales bacterium]|nr:THUMP domain-containing protein [Eubacteriales bacterium]
MRKLLMVRYGEIYLKGLNRPYFLRALVSRVREAAKPFGGKVWLHDARVFVSDMNDPEGCMERVRKVFGVHSVCPAIEMEKDDFDGICQQAELMMRPLSGTFKVESRRADKHYFLDSPQ